MWRNVINLGGRLLIICLVAGLALAGTYSLTQPIKAANDAAKAEAALREIYPEAESFTAYTEEELGEVRNAGYDTVSAVNVTNDGGALVTLTVQGYHEMSIMVGIMPDGTVAGYKVLSHTETANLGDRVTTEEFAAQFKGVSTPARYGNGLEAVSGATFSSNGVLTAINTAAEVQQFVGGAR